MKMDFEAWLNKAHDNKELDNEVELWCDFALGAKTMLNGLESYINVLSFSEESTKRKLDVARAALERLMTDRTWGTVKDVEEFVNRTLKEIENV